MQGKQHLKSDAAAQYLGLAETTLAKMRCYGNGPTYVKLGRAVVYALDDLDAFINANKRKNTGLPIHVAEAAKRMTARLHVDGGNNE